MTERFKNKYRVPSARLPNWDYSTHAAYFVTICTARHEHYFGEIVYDHPGFHTRDGCVHWQRHVETPCMASLPPTTKSDPIHPPDPIHQRNRTVAPIGYVHMQLSAIGEIAGTEWLKTPGLRPDMNLILDKFVVMPDHFHGIIIIGPNEFNSTPHPDSRVFGPQRKNLGSLIRGFKSSVTTFARKNNIDSRWQERFWDRIIRNDEEFDRIAQYIEDNPENWIKRHNASINHHLNCNQP